MISSWLVLYLGLGDVMDKHTAKRLAEINSGISLKNAKASIANQPQDTFEEETIRVLVNRGIQHDEAVARAKKVRETIERYNEASAETMDLLKEGLSKMYAMHLDMGLAGISNAFSPKEEK
jgi:hypothetical protein